MRNDEERPIVVVALADAWQAQELGRDIEEYFHGAYATVCAAGREQAERVLAAGGGSGRRIAAVLAQEDLPDGSGADLLHTARGVPQGGRLLLTGAVGADADGGRVDGVWRLPETPSQDALWPLLEQALYETAPEGDVKAVVSGDRRKREVHRVLRFLRLNAVPYQVREPAHGATVRVGNGSELRDPSLIALAEALGLVGYSGKTRYDVLVVGGGPAGLSAAINHAGLFGHSVLIVENRAPGGAAGTASNLIENHFGFPDGIKADALSQRGLRQARNQQVEWLPAYAAVKLSASGPGDADAPSHPVRLHVRSDAGDTKELRARALLVACGVANRRQGGEDERKYEGQGVYYLALPSDAEDVKETDSIVIVGGGDTAGRAALMFATRTSHVTMVIRGVLGGKDMLPGLVQQIRQASARIRVLEKTEVGKYCGADGQLTHVMVQDGEKKKPPFRVECPAAYVLIGAAPDTAWLKAAGVALNSHGYVLTGTDVRPEDPPPALCTNLPGVFAAGDVRFRGVRRISMAAGEGAAAALAVHEYFTGRSQLFPADGDASDAALRAYYA